MILLYAEKQDMGIRFAASLGGIKLGSTVVTTKNLANYQKETKALANKDGYIMTSFEGQSICVTWGWGHFGTLKGIKDYDPSLTKWYEIPLPFIPKKFEVKRTKHQDDFFQKRDDKQFEIIKKLFNSPKIDYIVNATDWEREGELIFAYIYDLTGTNKPYYRMRCNSKTDAQIHKDFKKLVDSKENEPYVMAARARSIADWIVGINLTIAATCNLSKDRKMLNVGRVLTPTLALIVNRENEIRAFSSKTTYGLVADFKTAKGTYKGKLENSDFVFTSEKDAKEAAKKFGDKGVIKSVERERKKISPPVLYDTKGLQVDANEYYGLTLEETLNVAQKLYESGYITYPRVDACYMTEDKKSEAAGLISLLSKKPEYKALIPSSPCVPDRYFKSVDAHDAIITTEVVPTKLTGNEALVYDLVARRFIMSCMDAAEKEKLTIVTDVDGEAFKTTGIKTISQGFEAALVKQKKDTEIPEDVAEKLTVEAVVTHNETTTKPPARYTDATLIKAMETCGRKLEDEELKGYLTKSKGIGRPSTRASIMERLVSIGYVERKKKTIYPTDKGMDAIASITIEDIKSPIMTAKWEERLDEIERSTPAESKKQTIAYIKDISNLVTEWCKEIELHKVKPSDLSRFGEKTDIACPICKEKLWLTKFNYKCDCGFTIPLELCHRKFKKTEIKTLVTKGVTGKLAGFKGSKKDFSASVGLVQAYKCTDASCGIIQSNNDKCYKCGSSVAPLDKMKVVGFMFK